MKLDFNKKVLVIGDIILDKYIYGDVKRTSPEAPVPVLNVKNEEYRLGGAANVAANVASLNGQTTLMGAVGNDKEGDVVKEMLEKRGIKFIPVESKSTILKTRYVGNRQQLLRVDIEEVEKKTFSLPDLNEFDSVVISDYAKGIVSQELFEKLNHKNVMINLKPKNADICKNISLVVLNESESNQITNTDDMERAIKILNEKFNTDIVITRGSRGMLIMQDKKIISLPTESKEVYDVSGAGDTSIATLALANKGNLEEAAMLANHAAGIVIQKAGTSTVLFKELKSLLEKENSKIKTREELQEIIQDLKLKEKKIIHTNGTYDILHAGHLQTLRNSKKLGDVLIVSINSDESVRKFKGAGRPILDQNERAALLASLEHVDYVTIFPEDDILKTLEMLKPDIHTKGGSFLEDRLAKEKELLHSWKGEFKQLPMIEDISTTNIIKRVLEVTANEKIKPFKKIDKVWGGEEWLVNNDRYCLKQLLLNEGYVCSYHYHRVKDETFLVKAGKVYIKIEGEDKILNEGDMQRIAPGKLHYFTSLTPSSVIFEVSTHHEDSDSYRETESGKIDLEQLKKDLMIKGLLK